MHPSSLIWYLRLFSNLAEDLVDKAKVLFCTLSYLIRTFLDGVALTVPGTVPYRISRVQTKICPFCSRVQKSFLIRSLLSSPWRRLETLVPGTVPEFRYFFFWLAEPRIIVFWLAFFRPAHRQLNHCPGRQGDGHDSHGSQGGGREERRLGPAHGALPRHAHRLPQHEK